MNIVPLDSQVRAQILPLAGRAGVLPQHHPVWVDILAACGEECQGLAAVHEGTTLGWLLYTVRSQPLGTVVSSLPMILYGGPAPLGGDPVLGEALVAGLRTEAERLGADVLSVGTSPLWSPQMEDVCRKVLGVTHEFENFVQLQSLDMHPLEQLNKKRRDAIRSEINRSTRHGLRVVSSLSPQQFSRWLEIYHARYAEIGARPYPDELHRSVYEVGVKAGSAMFWGVFDGEDLVGGTLFLLSGTVVDYFSSAFLTPYRHLYPNTFLLNEAFKAFMQLGIRHFNWQSSPNRGGVYQYKARWGATEGRHFYLSTLLRPDTRLLKTSITEVRQSFPFRFVLPFSAWSVKEEP